MNQSNLKIEKVNDEHYEIIRREDSRLMGAVVYSFDRGAWYNQPVGVISPKRINNSPIIGLAIDGLKFRLIHKSGRVHEELYHVVFCEVDGDRAWIHVDGELKSRVIPAMMPPGYYSVIKQFPEPVEIGFFDSFKKAVKFSTSPCNLP